MRIRMIKNYRVTEVYGAIDINKDDYPELEGMSDDEVLEYLKENMYEFELKDGTEGTLIDEFEFGTEIVKDDFFDEEHELYLVTE